MLRTSELRSMLSRVTAREMSDSLTGRLRGGIIVDSAACWRIVKWMSVTPLVKNSASSAFADNCRGVLSIGFSDS